MAYFLEIIPRSATVKHEVCLRHPSGYPCTCAMGNVYRFVEPVVLYMLRENGATHGYQLAASLQQHALTDAEIEGAAMYRTLRRLEEHEPELPAVEAELSFSIILSYDYKLNLYRSLDRSLLLPVLWKGRRGRVAIDRQIGT